MKSTVEQIRERFDNDVDRFSNLETGQSAIIDAPLTLELVTRAAAAVNPKAKRVLDIGCGAGNYTLKLLQVLPDLEVTLVDLSRPMLDRAVKRISPATSGKVSAVQSDIRDLDLAGEQFDIIMAGAVFHHLRADEEWREVFTKCFLALNPGGSLWICDLIEHSIPRVQAIMWQRYRQYLTDLQDAQYSDSVADYIEKEDTPRPLMFQLDLLRLVGFCRVELLHKHSCFAAFGAIK